jgi:hypothetical protein
VWIYWRRVAIPNRIATIDKYTLALHKSDKLFQRIQLLVGGISLKFTNLQLVWYFMQLYD